MRARRGALSLLAALSTGCDAELPFGRLLDPDAAAPAPDAGTPYQPRPPATFSCTQRGPLFDLSDGADGACGAASRGFHYALCSCEELVQGGPTRSDGFDSRTAPYEAGQASGALATNRGLFLASANLGGSLIIAGSTGTPLTADLTVAGNLFDQGPLQGPHTVRVAGRAEVAGDVRLDRLEVAGGLTLGDEAALELAAPGPTVQRAPVFVPAACSCAAPLALDPLIEAARAQSDNGAIGLDAASSLALFDAPRELVLPCGRFFVSKLYAAHALSLRIEGRVALYVRDSIVIEPSGSLTITLAGDAELDLFVQHGIAAGGRVNIGDARAPTRTRLYFGGGDSLYFGGDTELAASLYAPRSELVAQASFALYGAALLRRVASDGALALHFDRALSDDRCSAASCVASRDCARALRCDHGRCLP